MRSIAIDSYLINNASLHNYIIQIAECYDFNIISYSELSQINPDQTQAVVTGRIGEWSDKILDNLICLRLVSDFRGPI